MQIVKDEMWESAYLWVRIQKRRQQRNSEMFQFEKKKFNNSRSARVINLAKKTKKKRLLASLMTPVLEPMTFWPKFFGHLVISIFF